VPRPLLVPHAVPVRIGARIGERIVSFDDILDLHLALQSCGDVREFLDWAGVGVISRSVKR